MTNYVPPSQTLILKGLRSGTSSSEIEEFCQKLTPYMVGFNFKKDKKPFNSMYNYMAYLNYGSEEQARLAYAAIMSETNILKKKGHSLDLSRITPVLAADLNSLTCRQSFTLWLGNIHNATEDTLRQAFSRYGALAAEEAVRAKWHETTGQRYAFVNFVAYVDAKAAQQACDRGEM